MIFASMFPELLLRASGLLVLSSIFVAVTLRCVKPHSVGIHRTAWLSVLLSGVMLTPLTITLPWLEPENHSVGDSSSVKTLAEASSFEDRFLDVPRPVPTSEHRSGRISADDSETTTKLPTEAASFTETMILIWGSGAVILLAAGIVAWMLLVLVLLRCQSIDKSGQQEADSVAAELGLRQSVPVVVHNTIGPLLCLTPRGYRIVVPGDTWHRLTTLQRRAVLRHELAHRQRHDVLKSLGARFLVLIHWFNPFAWWAAHQFDEAAEWACDESSAGHPQQVAALASALLDLVERNSSRQPLLIGNSAVQGASLSTRIQRLLKNDHPHSKEPLMKRLSILLVIALIVVAGTFRFRLVAQPPVEFSTSTELNDLQSWRDHAGSLAERLAVDGNERLKEFRESLMTEAGLIVLQDRVGYREEEARNDLRETLLHDVLSRHFDQSTDEYKLRENMEDYRTSILTRSEQLNNSIQIVGRVLREQADRLETKTETEKLLTRYIESDAAALMLFLETVDGMMEPSADDLLNESNGLFVSQANGTVSVHPANRDRAQAQLRLLQKMDEKRELIEAELADWLVDLSDADELHTTVRAAFQNPLFPAVIMSSELERDSHPGDVDRKVEDFFGELEELTLDTANGLVIRTEARDEVAGHMREFEQLTRAAERLRQPLSDLSDRFTTEDELNREWKAMLVSNDVVQIRLSHEFGGAGLDPAELVQELIHEVLEETESGTLQVRSDREEELQEHIQEQFGAFRALRRGARRVNQLTQRIADSDLREAFDTWGGRLLLKSEIENHLRRLSANGFELWLEEMFRDEDGRLVLKDKAQDEILEFLADVSEVNRELSNDDFQRADDDRDDDNSDQSDR